MYSSLARATLPEHDEEEEEIEFMEDIDGTDTDESDEKMPYRTIQQSTPGASQNGAGRRK